RPAPPRSSGSSPRGARGRPATRTATATGRTGGRTRAMSEERVVMAPAERPELRPAAVPAGPALAVRARPGPIVPLLAASDALALVLAFLVTSLAIPTMRGRAGVHAEGVLLFAIALPGWFAGARLYGLYAAEPGRELLGRAGEWTNVGRLMVVGT